MSYDSTTNYADKCRNIYHHDGAKEAGLILELDDTLLYCSKNCKNNGDKYRNEELQNETPKTKALLRRTRVLAIVVVI